MCFFDPAEGDSNLELENILLGHKNPTVPGAVSTYTNMSPMFKEKFDCMTLEKSYFLAF